MVKPVSPWSVPVTIDEIAEAGSRYDLAAGGDVRAGVAKLAGLGALPRLEASYDVSRRGNGLHVMGRVSATVGQNCVVTLELIENEIEETVDLLFVPQVAAPKGKSAQGRKEPPEPLIGGTVDLGAITTEFLVLGIDPYPRKAGAQFAPAQFGKKSAEAASNPFAALEVLKKGRTGGDS